jgi:hypothetical protein|tara:strand:+ start:231 stop:365 length:135 start_codon:yes stop_codon:yes gene_type:complete
MDNNIKEFLYNYISRIEVSLEEGEIGSAKQELEALRWKIYHNTF